MLTQDNAIFLTKIVGVIEWNICDCVFYRLYAV